jgi:hypothetical protein
MSMMQSAGLDFRKAALVGSGRRRMADSHDAVLEARLDGSAYGAFSAPN